MKRIYLLMLLAIGVVSNSVGQTRVPDLSIQHRIAKAPATPVLITDNIHIIYDGGDGPTTPIKYNVSWWIINHGATAADTIHPSDSLFILSPWGTRYSGIGTNIGKDDTVALSPTSGSIQFKPNDTVTSKQVTITGDWCDSVWVKASPASPTPVVEANLANNITCNTVILDIWAVSVKNTLVIEGSGLLVFPNPNTGKLTFKYDFGHNADASVSIVDVMGKTVYQNELKAMSGMQDVQVEAGNLASGMYMLKVSANNKISAERFYVQ